jgi:hypothetical protein
MDASEQKIMDFLALINNAYNSIDNHLRKNAEANLIK